MSGGVVYNQGGATGFAVPPLVRTMSIIKPLMFVNDVATLGIPFEVPAHPLS